MCNSMVNKFGIRLKELRKDKKLSMKQLSLKVGIADSCISRWENGQTIVNAEQLIVFSKFFNVSVDYLLGLRDYD
ncbi:MAG: helix-turn-helix domain-containing protein [Clostridia bacterium]